jgi:AcrR family transcriptional regulator
MDDRTPWANSPSQHPVHRPSPNPPPAGQTVLQRQLQAGAPARRATALDAFALAKRRFLHGQRVDMGGLSRELGVNRVTLYRWVGTREQLLVEILWSMAERTLSDELKRVEAEDSASNRVARLLSNFVRICLSNAGLRQLQRDEGELAFRLLTLAPHGFHPRFVTLVRDLLAEDVAAGRLQTPVPLDDLAYTAVRIVESYVHRAAITGDEPDADRAARVLHALLR